MEDREQIAELSEIMERNAKVISSGLVGYCQTDFWDLASILVGEGYIRQPEQCSSQPEPNPTSLDELRVPPIEPPQNKVEAMRQEIAKFYPHCFSTYCPDPPTLAEPDRPLNCPEDCNVCLARQLLKLFPEPKQNEHPERQLKDHNLEVKAIEFHDRLREKGWT